MHPLVVENGTIIWLAPVCKKVQYIFQPKMFFKGYFIISILRLGPPDDMEEESDLSVTELKEIAAEKARLKAEKAKEIREKEEEEERKNEYGGRDIHEVTWGMADDATEDNPEADPDNPDMSKNPFSLDGSNREELNLEDPKKTLRGWFEREGFELVYDCQEKGKMKIYSSGIIPVYLVKWPSFKGCSIM